MTRVASLTKEVRALLPAWLGCAATLGAVAVFGDPRLYGVGLLAFALGSVALGATSIGHEYTHRTLAMLLSQPASRRQVFLEKLAVLTLMLLALGAMALVLLHKLSGFHHYWGGNWPQATVLLLPALCGLFVAPLLTMLCRSPLAGMVFTILVPALMWVSSEALAVAIYGWAPDNRPEMERFKLAVFWRGILGFSAVAAVLNWRMFMRLEAIDGPDPDVHLPAWLMGKATAAAPIAPARDRHPVWLLVKKELHLQQMSCVVAGLYVLGWVSLSLLRRIVPEFFGPPLGAITILYGGLVALLIGSLASAEERQFGTLEWQVLLPMATWKQWAVKAGTALSLVMLLALGLPLLLTYVLPSADAMGFNLLGYAGAIILLTTGSLYVSSLCTSGLRAMVLSIPVTLVVGPLLAWLLSTFFLTVRQLGWGLLVLAPAFLALILRFALVNHRSAERRARRVWLQVGLMAGFLALGVELLAVVVAFTG